MGGLASSHGSSRARVVIMGWVGRGDETVREDNVEKGFRDGYSWLNSSKREELKFGRAQLRQCHEIEVLTRAFQLVGLIFIHFLWIHWSHESH